MSRAREPLRVGVVGGGYVGQLAHIANLCEYERCRVVALTDLRPELSRRVAEHYGIARTYPSHHELLAADDVEAVVVVTTRSATGPIVLDALRSGRHVLSEKPMAHTLEQGRRLVLAARKHDLCYTVGFMKRHDAGVLRARDLLRGYLDHGTLGELQYIRAYSLHGNIELDVPRTVMSEEPRPEGLELWPTAPAWLDAGESEEYANFLNVHGHAINLLRFLFTDQPKVEPAKPQRGAARGLPFRLGNVSGVLETCENANGPWTEGIDAYFERGSVHLTLPPPFAREARAGLIVREPHGITNVEPDGCDWAFRRQARAWVDDVLESRIPSASGEDSLADLAIIESIWPSRRVLGDSRTDADKGSLTMAASKPYLSVPWSYLPKQFHAQAVEEILEQLRLFVPTGDFTLGRPLVEFEQKFARLVGARHGIGVNSGTDAIKLSLKALGVQAGDEIITAANTFIATVGAIVEIGAKPIFVDCTDNFCLNTDALEEAITSRTKALLPVHFAGQMSDMGAVTTIAERHRLPVIEDACQCILGNIGGRNAGTWGKSGAFSLHPLKNLNVWGDGGMIVTDDDQLAEHLRLLRNHGLINRDEVIIMGYNSRLDTTQAVIGNWLIEQVDYITDTRISNAAMLDEGLGQIPEITLPPRYENRRLVYHLYMVFAERRDELLRYCLDHGIEAKIHYRIPVYLQPALRNLCKTKPGDFPTADRHAQTLISFPAHEHLNQSQLHHIIATVMHFYKTLR